MEVAFGVDQVSDWRKEVREGERERERKGLTFSGGKSCFQWPQGWYRRDRPARGCCVDDQPAGRRINSVRPGPFKASEREGYSQNGKAVEFGDGAGDRARHVVILEVAGEEGEQQRRSGKNKRR